MQTYPKPSTVYRGRHCLAYIQVALNSALDDKVKADKVVADQRKQLEVAEQNSVKCGKIVTSFQYAAEYIAEANDVAAERNGAADSSV